MRKKLAGVAFAAGLVVAGNANAANYYVAILDKQSMFALDLDTLTVTGSTVTVWTLLVKRQPKPYKGKAVDYDYIKNEFDCGGSRWRMTYIGTYGPDGSSFEAGKTDGEWQEVIPGSASAILLKAACKPDERDPKAKSDQSSRDLIDAYRTVMSGSEQ